MNLIEKEGNIEKTISELKNSDNKFLVKKGIKLEEIKNAQDKGWKGITLEELDYDVEEIYQKLVEYIKNTNELDKNELAIISIVNNIRKDKIDLIKFMKTQEIKLKELELKYEDTRNAKSKKEIEL